jgi:hypothetical protein
MQKLLYAILFIAVAAKAQKHQTGVKQAAQTKKINDTLFISREVTKEDYCAVYIQKNRRSREYDWLLDFKMDSFENVDYKQNLESLQRHMKKSLKRYDLAGLPREWVPLYLYKGHYYIYSPSEPGYLDRRFITDSTMVYWYMDGPFPEAISTIKKINGHTWYFETGPHRLEKITSRLTIHIIDPKNMIAVWEDASESRTFRYGLYVPREYARNFDVIVNFCSENKAAEFSFDRVDYADLLKGK